LLIRQGVALRDDLALAVVGIVIALVPGARQEVERAREGVGLRVVVPVNAVANARLRDRPTEVVLRVDFRARLLTQAHAVSRRRDGDLELRLLVLLHAEAVAAVLRRLVALAGYGDVDLVLAQRRLFRQRELAIDTAEGARRLRLVEDFLPVRIADNDGNVPAGERLQITALPLEQQLAVVDH